MRKDIWIMGGIFAVVIGFVVFLAVRSSQPPAPIDTTNLLKDSSHMTGVKGAKVTIVEFGDYQCPACATAEPVIEQILAAYQNDPNFNFAFRHFPLPQHLNAPMAAEAAEAAGEQGKFWEMHSKLYVTQTAWSEMPKPLDTFVQYAKDLGLDTAKFKASVEQSKFADAIEADKSDGTAVGINATPTFFVNGEAVVGVPNADTLKKMIEAGLSK